jgi:hypothetical protein
VEHQEITTRTHQGLSGIAKEQILKPSKLKNDGMPNDFLQKLSNQTWLEVP